MRIATLLLSALLLTSSAAAQTTPLIDTPVFRLNDDGGLVSRGTFGTGVIPSSGPGQRLMWYPAKAAFRAGAVTGFHWYPAFIGAYSVAMGFNTTANGDYTVALGRLTKASGLVSTAMGYDTEASGDYATAMGRATTSMGDYAIAMGQGTEASGDWSTAMGREATASGAYAMATGQNTTASGTYATAMGGGPTASGDYAVAMGYSTTASGHFATAMGRETTAQAYTSLVLGRWNTVAGDSDTWVSTDLVVGNGNTTSNRSNALTLLKNGDLTIAGTLTENSDRRLKTDIEPLSDAVSALKRVQPVRYRFREGINRPEGVQIGLIAQEVEAVYPEVVSRGADGYLSVSYTNLVTVLVQALNEQQTEIDALHERLAHLEATLFRFGAGPETTSALGNR